MPDLMFTKTENDPDVGLEISAIVIYPRERTATVQLRGVKADGRISQLMGGGSSASFSGEAYDAFAAKICPDLIGCVTDHLVAEKSIADVAKAPAEPEPVADAPVPKT